MKNDSKHSLCPCGSARLFNECCRPLIDGEIIADTPELLMRSRYSAYSLGYETYLTDTWHSSTRPAALNLKEGPAIKWTSLDILQAPPPNASEGFVEFIAHFKENGKAGKLHEVSCFKLEDSKWYYLNGEIK